MVTEDGDAEVVLDILTNEDEEAGEEEADPDTGDHRDNLETRLSIHSTMICLTIILLSSLSLQHFLYLVSHCESVRVLLSEI